MATTLYFCWRASRRHRCAEAQRRAFGAPATHPPRRKRRFTADCIAGLLLALVVSSACADTALEQARSAHGAADFPTALSLYNQVIQSASNASDVKDASLGVAACHFSSGQLDAAANAFLAFAAAYPTDVSALVATVQAGNVRLAQGRLTEAEALYDRVASMGRPDAADAYLWLGWQALGKGRVLTARGSYAQAVPFLTRAAKQASEPRVAELAEEALGKCAEGMKLRISNDPVRLARSTSAAAYEQQGQYGQAIELWSAEANRTPEDDFAIECVGRIAAICEIGKYAAQARQALQTLAAAHPGSALAGAASLEAGKALLAAGDMSGALLSLKKAQSLQDTLPEVAPTIAALVRERAQQARTLARGPSAQWAAAAAQWMLVATLETRPIDRGDALMNRGELLKALGDRPGAQACFASVIADPTLRADTRLFQKVRLLSMLCHYEDRRYEEAQRASDVILSDPLTPADMRLFVARILTAISTASTVRPDGGS